MNQSLLCGFSPDGVWTIEEAADTTSVEIAIVDIPARCWRSGGDGYCRRPLRKTEDAERYQNTGDRNAHPQSHAVYFSIKMFCRFFWSFGPGYQTKVLVLRLPKHIKTAGYAAVARQRQELRGTCAIKECSGTAAFCASYKLAG
ncbi:MAG: hypothetical protein U0074_05685 [Kouleothrix sp.]